MKNKNIEQYNENGQRHGYWEMYWSNGNPHFKGNAINGQPHGYWERYWFNGSLWYKGYYDNGKPIGCWEWYNDGTLIEQIFYT